MIPLLRKQPGFRDEVTFLPADGSGDAVAISFWEKRENADAYQRGAYPEVLKAVAKVADGTRRRSVGYDRAVVGTRCVLAPGKSGPIPTFPPNSHVRSHRIPTC